jgi:integrase
MSVRKRTWVTRLGEEKEAWVVAYSVFDGEKYTRHIETFQKKKDADAYHDKVRADVREGRHTAPSKSPTVREAADQWIKRAEADGCERSTIKNYRECAALHIVPRLGAIKLASLTPNRIEKFRDDLLASGASRTMARKALSGLKSLLKVAKYAHVAADVKIAPNKRAGKLEVGRDIPTPGEIKRLVEAAKDNRKRALLLTAALTGLRASELRGLRWKDVDLKADELHVRQRADRYNTIGMPKSESGTRSVPLAPELLAALKEWKLACPKGELDLVFPTSTGRIEHHKNMLRSLERVMKAAGVVTKNGTPKYALHAFRHFFASWCINPKERGGREMSAKVVQQLLGHSSIVMTLDRYGHLFPRGDDRAELAKASAALLG